MNKVQKMDAMGRYMQVVTDKYRWCVAVSYPHTHVYEILTKPNGSLIAYAQTEYMAWKIAATKLIEGR